MKRNLMLVCSIAMIVFGVSGLLYNRLKDTPDQKQVFKGLQLHPDMCELLFDCTPTDFFEKEFSFYEETGDFREDSYVDSRGWLMLIFSEEQGKKWAQTDWLKTFPEIADYPEIEISENLNKITIYTTDGKASEDAYYAVDKVLAKLDMLKYFSDVPEKNNYTTIYEIDSKTGEVLSQEKYYHGPKPE